MLIQSFIYLGGFFNILSGKVSHSVMTPMARLQATLIVYVHSTSMGTYGWIEINKCVSRNTFGGNSLAEQFAYRTFSIVAYC